MQVSDLQGNRGQAKVRVGIQMSVIVKGKNANKPHTVRYWTDGKQRERSFATLGRSEEHTSELQSP